MKLFLSSMHPSNHEALLSLFTDQATLSAVIVPNGWDTYPAERKQTELNHVVTTLEDFGFTTSLLDLTDATKDSIQETLKDKSFVWVMADSCWECSLTFARNSNRFIHSHYFICIHYLMQQVSNRLCSLRTCRVTVSIGNENTFSAINKAQTF